MLNKFFFLTVFIAALTQSCGGNSTQANQLDKNIKTDSLSNLMATHKESAKDSIPSVLCSDLLPKKEGASVQKTYFDTLSFDNSLLFFMTRDSALSVYRQKGNNCTFLLKIPIDSTDLYGYRDGSPLFLQDMDGDNQKEVLVTVAINGGHSNYRVYRLIKEKEHIVLKKILRFEEFTNPEYDKASGMVRIHWFERGNYELDEFYTLSKDDVLQFVKGTESRNGIERKYTTKKGW